MKDRKTISIGQVSRNRKNYGDVMVGESNYVDYKNIDAIRRYTNRFLKIEPSRRTGLSSRSQRALTAAIKRARHLGLIGFTLNHR